MDKQLLRNFKGLNVYIYVLMATIASSSLELRWHRCWGHLATCQHIASTKAPGYSIMLTRDKWHKWDQIWL